MVGKPVILFDLDGTLIVPRDGNVPSGASIHSTSAENKRMMKKIAVSYGVLPSEIEDLDRMAHIWNKARRYAELNGFDKARTSRMMSELNILFNRQEAFEHSISTLVPGTIDGLMHLSQESYALGMVTTASRNGFERASRHHQFGSYFRYSITRDDCVYVKPDPEPIHRILRLFDSHDFIYIGDSDHDAEASRAAGGGFVLLNTKRYDEEDLRKMNPDGIIINLGELSRMLSSP